MNGWYEGASAAARDRMERFHREASLARELRLAQLAGGRAAAASLRRRVARALHRLADALAPQPGDAVASR